MTVRQAGSRAADPHTLVGAYVMDAVSAGDRARFEQHLGGCETCRAEVRGLREATAQLAAAAAVRPRAGLREQTMQAAGLIRQLPPVTSPGPADPRPPRAWRPSGWRARASSSRASSSRGWFPRGWISRLALGLAVACAAAVVVLGTAMHGAEHRLAMDQGRSHTMATVLGAPDVTMLTAQVSIGGSATVMMSHRAGALVFTAHGLPPLAASRTYQLWLMGPDGPRSAGLLPAARDGMSGPMVISRLAPGERVALTVEPGGGSPRPTAAPVLVLSLGS